MPDNEATKKQLSASKLQTLWLNFCKFITKVFYRNIEIQGLENIPENGAVLLCANHVSALADAVIIQAVIPRVVHPIVRHGLFDKRLLRPVLNVLQAVPIYRQQDVPRGSQFNKDAFSKCYEMFANQEVMLIFPEGQSHDDPHLHNIKSGASRMALGAKEHNITPSVIPIGINFSQRGKFRSSVFISIGEPIELENKNNDSSAQHVRHVTQTIQTSLENVTLNVEDWEEFNFLKRVERFFAMRHAHYRKRNLAQRFYAWKALNKAYQELREFDPDLMKRVNVHLYQFERICRRCGVRDYHLTIQYRPLLILRFILRSVFLVTIILPFGIWGLLTSGIPFYLTRLLSTAFIKNLNQFDTTKMALGFSLFVITWAIQVVFVFSISDSFTALAYFLSLIAGSLSTLILIRQREATWDNIRVFFAFAKRKKLRLYLEYKRKEIEKELAKIVKQTRRKQARAN